MFSSMRVEKIARRHRLSDGVGLGCWWAGRFDHLQCPSIGL